MARSKRLFFALAPASMVLVVACNNLLGLNDFEAVECNGGRCADGSLPDTFVPDDTGIPDAQDETTGTTPAVWAQWPMPNYDAGAVFLPNQESYDGGTGFISDNVTGLTWQTKPLVDGSGSARLLTEDAAEKACADSPGGPWRLPKRIELASLLNFGQTAPLIDPLFGVPNVTLWTSSQKKPFDATNPAYWVVDFSTGVVRASAAGTKNVFPALCVKAK